MGFTKYEEQIKAEGYGDLARRLSLAVALFSGDEPLLRKDIAAIIGAVRQSNDTPYLTLVTNGMVLNQGNYLQLREAGVNQFSVSPDFSDK